MDAFRTAYIYIRNKYAGELKETDEGYCFTYDPGYLAQDNASAVSLTLPICAGRYESNTLFSFFDGLIPEGWMLEY